MTAAHSSNSVTSTTSYKTLPRRHSIQCCLVCLPGFFSAQPPLRSLIRWLSLTCSPCLFNVKFRANSLNIASYFITKYLLLLFGVPCTHGIATSKLVKNFSLHTAKRKTTNITGKTIKNKRAWAQETYTRNCFSFISSSVQIV